MQDKLQRYISKNDKIIGSIASLVGILMFFSLIEVFLSNLAGKSNIYIQPGATLANCLIWSIYAFGKKDWFLLVPNLLGIILGAMTIIAAFI